MDLLNEYFTKNNLIDEINIIITSTNDNICEKAAASGYVNLLKYAHESGCLIYDKTSKKSLIF